MPDPNRAALIGWHRSQERHAEQRACSTWTRAIGLDRYWIERAGWHGATADMLEADGLVVPMPEVRP